MANTLLSNRLRSRSSGSGSGSSPPRQLNGVAGCRDYGAPIVLHQTNDASTDAIDGFGTGAGILSNTIAAPKCGVIIPAGYTATSGLATGAAPVPGISCADIGTGQFTGGAINATPNPVGSIWQANTVATMYETLPNELAFVTCGAGDWIVNQRVCAQTGGTDLAGLSPNALWTDTYVLLVDHTGTVKKTIGHATATPFVTGDIETMVVKGKATLLGSTDRIVILLVWTYYFNVYSNSWNPAVGDCTNGSGSGSGALWPFYEGPSLARDQVIVTPMYNIKAVFPALKLRDASGSGSGRRRALYGIARGCGPYKLAKKLRGARAVAGSGSGSGHRERAVWGIADCCLPFTGGSGSGGSGGTETDGCIIVSCSGGVAARQFRLVVSGITDGNCSPCSLYNGDWTLTYVNNCVWQSELRGFVDCPGGARDGVAWTFTWSTGLTGGLVTYTPTVGSWDCMSPLTLTYSGTPTHCLNMPASLTITPI